MSVNDNFDEEFARDVQVEDCRDSDWSEEAYEESVSNILNLMDQTQVVVSEDHRQTSEKQNHNPERDESVDRYHIVVQEFMPWTDRSVPHKYGHIQQHVYRRLEGVVHSL